MRDNGLARCYSEKNQLLRGPDNEAIGHVYAWTDQPELCRAPGRSANQAASISLVFKRPRDS